MSGYYFEIISFRSELPRVEIQLSTGIVVAGDAFEINSFRLGLLRNYQFSIGIVIGRDDFEIIGFRSGLPLVEMISKSSVFDRGCCGQR